MIDILKDILIKDSDIDIQYIYNDNEKYVKSDK